ncbi:MAG: hypothetical protein AB2693_27455, partial [Candidatus Thiodiazotropha sp.]
AALMIIIIGPISQSEERLAQESEIPGSIPGLVTLSAYSRKADLVLVHCLRGLSLPIHDMTIVVVVV